LYRCSDGLIFDRVQVDRVPVEVSCGGRNDVEVGALIRAHPFERETSPQNPVLKIDEVQHSFADLPCEQIITNYGSALDRGKV
jgi:hypothetical protein